MTHGRKSYRVILRDEIVPVHKVVHGQACMQNWYVYHKGEKRDLVWFVPIHMFFEKNMPMEQVWTVAEHLQTQREA